MQEPISIKRVKLRKGKVLGIYQNMKKKSTEMEQNLIVLTGFELHVTLFSKYLALKLQS